MAGSRQSVQLTEAEIEDFLGSQMKVQVATVGPDGAPHLTTLFYVLDEGKIAFWTYGSSQKVRNLRRDPRVTCLVEDGEDYFELRGVSITGQARLVEDYEEIKALGSQVMARMAGGADPSTSSGHRLGGLGEDLVSKQAHKRVGIVIEPDKVASWDHRKLGALPGQG
ncbi:pyridoxamine 5'-phosphate oxidase family protein [Nocardioides panzhihuensis]|uniref:PPOX class probable F420-dependent enzyme n=1 Tax=Nocardioides panzhihuensis TaxID=860243 RepID=A0A7Z0DKW9_9ACTN|nr:pyridoxamine 5'-phosphate oxidase family protein [Nocardioides panzhihuensis]NYI77504.1 PPOX class probable F420-dependent enzyme [Nocardioides panzhihuensis]